MLKILIVDDDNIVLMLQSKLLQRCGITHETIPFKGGKEALAYLTSCDKNQDLLILLDINMPVMNGWQFLEEMKKLQNPARMKVVMVTSSINLYDKEKSREFPNVIGFVEKPITVENCEKIKNLPALKQYF